MGVARQHQIEAPAGIVLHPLGPVGQQDREGLPVLGGGHRLQLLPPDILPHVGIVDAADAEGLPRRGDGGALPLQHHGPAGAEQLLDLLHPLCPELVIAGDVVHRPRLRQGLHCGQGPLLGHPGIVVHDVAAQQHQIRTPHRHRVQQVFLPLPVGAGVEIGEHRQPHRRAHLLALYGISTHHQPGVQPGQQGHPGNRRQAQGQGSLGFLGHEPLHSIGFHVCRRMGSMVFSSPSTCGHSSYRQDSCLQTRLPGSSPPVKSASAALPPQKGNTTAEAG